MAAVFEAIAPRMLLVSRGDLWPELLAVAHDREVPAAVIGGLISPGSPRLSWPWRALLGDLCRPISYVGAVSVQDAERFVRLGVPAAAVEVTGDPRHDQVLERIPDLAAVASLVTWSAGRNVLVAGSTHPPDHAVVLRAFRTVLDQVRDAALILIPHEPARDPIRRVCEEGRLLNIPTATWPGPTDLAPAAAIVVKSRGHLAELYVCGNVAYVGGGFGRAGVHAVIEPAAFGVPVVFGPQWSRSPDARSLLSIGGATALDAEGAATQLAASWMSWIGDATTRSRTGLRARGAIQTGAAARIAARLLTAV